MSTESALQQPDDKISAMSADTACQSNLVEKDKNLSLILLAASQSAMPLQQACKTAAGDSSVSVCGWREREIQEVEKKNFSVSTANAKKKRNTERVGWASVTSRQPSCYAQFHRGYSHPCTCERKPTMAFRHYEEWPQHAMHYRFYNTIGNNGRAGLQRLYPDSDDEYFQPKPRTPSGRHFRSESKSPTRENNRTKNLKPGKDQTSAPGGAKTFRKPPAEAPRKPEITPTAGKSSEMESPIQMESPVLLPLPPNSSRIMPVSPILISSTSSEETIRTPSLPSIQTSSHQMPSYVDSRQNNPVSMATAAPGSQRAKAKEPLGVIPVTELVRVSSKSRVRDLPSIEGSRPATPASDDVSFSFVAEVTPEWVTSLLKFTSSVKKRRVFFSWKQYGQFRRLREKRENGEYSVEKSGTSPAAARHRPKDDDSRGDSSGDFRATSSRTAHAENGNSNSNNSTTAYTPNTTLRASSAPAFAVVGRRWVNMNQQHFVGSLGKFASAGSQSLWRRDEEEQLNRKKKDLAINTICTLTKEKKRALATSDTEEPLRRENGDVQPLPNAVGLLSPSAENVLRESRLVQMPCMEQYDEHAIRRAVMQAKKSPRDGEKAGKAVRDHFDSSYLIEYMKRRHFGDTTKLRDGLLKTSEASYVEESTDGCKGTGDDHEEGDEGLSPWPSCSTDHQKQKQMEFPPLANSSGSSDGANPTGPPGKVNPPQVKRVPLWERPPQPKPVVRSPSPATSPTSSPSPSPPSPHCTKPSVSPYSNTLTVKPTWHWRKRARNNFKMVKTGGGYHKKQVTKKQAASGQTGQEQDKEKMPDVPTTEETGKKMSSTGNIPATVGADLIQDNPVNMAGSAPVLLCLETDSSKPLQTGGTETSQQVNSQQSAVSDQDVQDRPSLSIDKKDGGEDNEVVDTETSSELLKTGPFSTENTRKSLYRYYAQELWAPHDISSSGQVRQVENNIRKMRNSTHKVRRKTDSDASDETSDTNLCYSSISSSSLSSWTEYDDSPAFVTAKEHHVPDATPSPSDTFYSTLSQSGQQTDHTEVTSNKRPADQTKSSNKQKVRCRKGEGTESSEVFRWADREEAKKSAAEDRHAKLYQYNANANRYTSTPAEKMNRIQRDTAGTLRGVPKPRRKRRATVIISGDASPYRPYGITLKDCDEDLDCLQGAAWTHTHPMVSYVSASTDKQHANTCGEQPQQKTDGSASTLVFEDAFSSVRLQPDVASVRCDILPTRFGDSLGDGDVSRDLSFVTCLLPTCPPCIPHLRPPPSPNTCPPNTPRACPPKPPNLDNNTTEADDDDIDSLVLNSHSDVCVDGSDIDMPPSDAVRDRWAYPMVHRHSLSHVPQESFQKTKRRPTSVQALRTSSPMRRSTRHSSAVCQPSRKFTQQPQAVLKTHSKSQIKHCSSLKVHAVQEPIPKPYIPRCLVGNAHAPNACSRKTRILQSSVMLARPPRRSSQPLAKQLPPSKSTIKQQSQGLQLSHKQSHTPSRKPQTQHLPSQKSVAILDTSHTSSEKSEALSSSFTNASEGHSSSLSTEADKSEADNKCTDAQHSLSASDSEGTSSFSEDSETGEQPPARSKTLHRSKFWSTYAIFDALHPSAARELVLAKPKVAWCKPSRSVGQQSSAARRKEPAKQGPLRSSSARAEASSLSTKMHQSSYAKPKAQLSPKASAQRTSALKSEPLKRQSPPSSTKHRTSTLSTEKSQALRSVSFKPKVSFKSLPTSDTSSGTSEVARSSSEGAGSGAACPTLKKSKAFQSASTKSEKLKLTSTQSETLQTAFTKSKAFQPASTESGVFYPASKTPEEDQQASTEAAGLQTTSAKLQSRQPSSTKTEAPQLTSTESEATLLNSEQPVVLQPTSIKPEVPQSTICPQEQAFLSTSTQSEILHPTSAKLEIHQPCSTKTEAPQLTSAKSEVTLLNSEHPVVLQQPTLTKSEIPQSTCPQEPALMPTSTQPESETLQSASTKSETHQSGSKKIDVPQLTPTKSEETMLNSEQPVVLQPTSSKPEVLQSTCTQKQTIVSTSIQSEALRSTPAKLEKWTKESPKSLPNSDTLSGTSRVTRSSSAKSWSGAACPTFKKPKPLQQTSKKSEKPELTSTQSETPQTIPTKSEAFRPASIESRAFHPASTTLEEDQPASTKADALQSTSTKLEARQPGSTKTEAPQLASTKSEATRLNSEEPPVLQPVASKPQVLQLICPQEQALMSTSTQPEGLKPTSVKSEALHPISTQPQTVQSECTQSAAPQPTTTKSEALRQTTTTSELPEPPSSERELQSLAALTEERGLSKIEGSPSTKQEAPKLSSVTHATSVALDPSSKGKVLGTSVWLPVGSELDRNRSESAHCAQWTLSTVLKASPERKNAPSVDKNGVLEAPGQPPSRSVSSSGTFDSPKLTSVPNVPSLRLRLMNLRSKAKQSSFSKSGNKTNSSSLEPGIPEPSSEKLEVKETSSAKVQRQGVPFGRQAVSALVSAPARLSSFSKSRSQAMSSTKMKEASGKSTVSFSTSTEQSKQPKTVEPASSESHAQQSSAIRSKIPGKSLPVLFQMSSQLLKKTFKRSEQLRQSLKELITESDSQMPSPEKTGNLGLSPLKSAKSVTTPPWVANSDAQLLPSAKTETMPFSSAKENSETPSLSFAKHKSETLLSSSTEEKSGIPLSLAKEAKQSALHSSGKTKTGPLSAKRKSKTKISSSAKEKSETPTSTSAKEKSKTLSASSAKKKSRKLPSLAAKGPPEKSDLLPLSPVEEKSKELLSSGEKSDDKVSGFSGDFPHGKPKEKLETPSASPAKEKPKELSSFPAEENPEESSSSEKSKTLSPPRHREKTKVLLSKERSKNELSLSPETSETLLTHRHKEKPKGLSSSSATEDSEPLSSSPAKGKSTPLSSFTAKEKSEILPSSKANIDTQNLSSTMPLSTANLDTQNLSSTMPSSTVNMDTLNLSSTKSKTFPSSTGKQEPKTLSLSVAKSHVLISRKSGTLPPLLVRPDSMTSSPAKSNTLSLSSSEKSGTPPLSSANADTMSPSSRNRTLQSLSVKSHVLTSSPVKSGELPSCSANSRTQPSSSKKLEASLAWSAKFDTFHTASAASEILPLSSPKPDTSSFFPADSESLPASSIKSVKVPFADFTDDDSKVLSSADVLPSLPAQSETPAAKPEEELSRDTPVHISSASEATPSSSTSSNTLSWSTAKSDIQGSSPADSDTSVWSTAKSDSPQSSSAQLETTQLTSSKTNVQQPSPAQSNNDRPCSLEPEGDRSAFETSQSFSSTFENCESLLTLSDALAVLEEERKKARRQRQSVLHETGRNPSENAFVHDSATSSPNYEDSGVKKAGDYESRQPAVKDAKKWRSLVLETATVTTSGDSESSPENTTCTGLKRTINEKVSLDASEQHTLSTVNVHFEKPSENPEKSGRELDTWTARLQEKSAKTKKLLMTQLSSAWTPASPRLFQSLPSHCSRQKPTRSRNVQAGRAILTTYRGSGSKKPSVRGLISAGNDSVCGSELPTFHMGTAAARPPQQTDDHALDTSSWWTHQAFPTPFSVDHFAHSLWVNPVPDSLKSTAPVRKKTRVRTTSGLGRNIASAGLIPSVNITSSQYSQPVLDRTPSAATQRNDPLLSKSQPMLHHVHQNRVPKTSGTSHSSNIAPPTHANSVNAQIPLMEPSATRTFSALHSQQSTAGAQQSHPNPLYDGGIGERVHAEKGAPVSVSQADDRAPGKPSPVQIIINIYGCFQGNDESNG